MTATAPSAPAEQPAAPLPPARKLLAVLTGQSEAGQAIKVTLEQSTSTAATVFLTITTDGEAAPPEKFLGVQKARGKARLLAIKKQLRGAKLEDFDEPAPEPTSAKPAAPVGKGTAATPAPSKGKPAAPVGKGKPAPTAPTAPVRTRDQITVMKQLGRYAALMIVGPNSRYEVVKDYGLPTAERVWELKATRAWQPQQRAAKDEVDRLYALDPSDLPAAQAPEATPAPEAAVPSPQPEPAPVVPPALVEPAKLAGKKAGGKKVAAKKDPTDDDPAL